MDSYLQRLTGKLIEGIEHLPEELRTRHARWLRARQNPDGGFSGREGGSDLYYTGFALRGLAVLQALDESIATRTAGFLRSRLQHSASIVDLFSLLVGVFLVRISGGPDVLADAPADWPERVAEVLERHRHPDGGYRKALEGTSGSTYTTFLVALALELLEKSIPEPDRTRQFLQARFREGGYVEIPQMKRAGTNPTAAGIGILRILGQLQEQDGLAVADFLMPMWIASEGAFRANDRIPAADLLSSFTAAWTLWDVGHLHRVDRVALRRYAMSLQDVEGGFRGGSWDQGVDVEYTFYGLGVLGLLADS